MCLNTQHLAFTTLSKSSSNMSDVHTKHVFLPTAWHQHTSSGIYIPTQFRCTHPKCFSTHSIWPLQPYPNVVPTCKTYTPQTVSLHTALLMYQTHWKIPPKHTDSGSPVLLNLYGSICILTDLNTYSFYVGLFVFLLTWTPRVFMWVYLYSYRTEHLEFQASMSPILFN